MPNEILAEIFEQCREPAVSVPPSSPKAFPWNLRHVCSLWRSTVDETPSLWRSLEFNLAESVLEPLTLRDFARSYKYTIPPMSGTMRAYPKSLGFETLALSNGQRRPLRLALKFGTRFENVPPSKIHALVPIILPHTERIQHIMFQGPLSAFQYLSTLSAGSFALLESLTVPAERWQTYDIEMNDAPLSTISPRLSSITLPYDISHFCLLSDFPLANITTLSIPNTRLNSNQVLQTLAMSPRLVVFSILSYEPLIDNPLPATTVDMLHLAELSVSVSNWVEPRWLARVSMPSLTNYSASSPATHAWASKMFVELPPRLENLTALTVDIQITPGNVWDILNSARHLERFDALSGAPLTQRVLTALAHDGLSPVLSSLGCLVISYHNSDRWDPVYSDDGGYNPTDPSQRYPDNVADSPFSQLCAFLDMLQMRAQNNTVAKISDIRIRDYTWNRLDWVNFEDVPKLKAMLEDKWNISIVG